MQLEKQAYRQGANIFYKSVLLMAYADDIVIIGNSLESMKEGFQLLEEASKEVGLIINEGKTKYMLAANTWNSSKPCTIEIGRYNFERVDSYMYVYLGSLVTGDSSVSEEITNRLIAANRSYFGLKSQLKSQLRKTKILAYNTNVRPIFTYAAETLTTTKNDERILSIFERKILRRMYKVVQI